MFKFGIDFIHGGLTFGTESAEMWEPMANAVGYGLIFATVLTLVVVPITYAIMDDLGNFIRKLFKREIQEFKEAELSKYDDIN
jgi:Cu/Ag efflux pump CusA